MSARHTFLGYVVTLNKRKEKILDFDILQVSNDLISPH